MVTTLKVEDILDGALNFRSWKAKILNLLEENDLDDYVTRVIPEPIEDNGKVVYKKNQSKVKRILFDLVKDHLISHISQLKTAKEVYDALTSLFEMKNPSRKRALRNKPCDVKMTKANTIATYFMKISQLKEQLIAIGETNDD
jgi:hypothetical protein